jgi:NO-binding membrane sensor protein with MHYT domain
MAASDGLLTGSYDPRLVALSVLIAVLASGAALDLAGRVTASQGRSRILWLVGGASVMGLGIWSMHYTGMLAFRLPIPVHYHLPTVLLSLLAAILASNVALVVASGERLTASRVAVGSLAMGSGIAAMHYIGMAAMRLPAAMRWNTWLVAASVAIAITVSAVALWLAFRHGHAGSDEWTWRKLGSATVMGAAIPGMHYTGMAAARFSASAEPVDTVNTMDVSALGAGAIGMSTLLVLLVAIGSSILDRRISAQALRLRDALAEVKALRVLLPICANCKRVRTDQGSWEQIESYMRLHTDAEFSHGICPDCAKGWDASGLG